MLHEELPLEELPLEELPLGGILRLGQGVALCSWVVGSGSSATLPTYTQTLLPVDTSSIHTEQIIVDMGSVSG